MTTPPRVWARVDGESGGSSGPWDTERVLHGLPVDVRRVAVWLEARLRHDPAAAREAPDAGSIEVAGAAVRALRDAVEAAGLDDDRRRALHAQLDRDFALLAAAQLDRRTSDSRALLRDVSHDLRSPLNSILFLADALATEHSGALNEVQRRQVGVLYSAAVSLVGLVNDLIDVTRLGDAATIEVVAEPFSVEAVLQQVDQLVGPLAAHAEVELAFRLETLGPRRGDRRVLTRILINLVSNAVQALDAGQRVEVRAFDRSSALAVTVVDTGGQADIEQLRARLAHAPLPTSADRGRGWTHGLGLAICGRLVEAAGGTLGVDRPSDGGCRFTLELPFPRA